MRRTKVEMLAKDVERTLKASFKDDRAVAVEPFEHGRNKYCIITDLSYNTVIDSFEAKTWEIMYNWLLLKLSQFETELDCCQSNNNVECEQMTLDEFREAFEKIERSACIQQYKRAIIEATNSYESLAGTASAYEVIKPIYEDLLCKLGTDNEIG